MNDPRMVIRTKTDWQLSIRFYLHRTFHVIYLKSKEESILSIRSGLLMAYYIDLFSPETYQAYGNSTRTISGFRERHRGIASHLKSGDKFAI